MSVPREEFQILDKSKNNAENEPIYLQKKKKDNYPLYKVENVSHPIITFIAAFQLVIISMSSLYMTVLVLANAVSDVRSRTIQDRVASSIFFSVGLSTLLQTTLGVRLPIMEVPAISYIRPVSDVKDTSIYMCGEVDKAYYSERNDTNSSIYFEDDINTAHQKMAMIPMMIVGIIQLIISASGLFGYVLPFIGPVTIVPTLVLGGLDVTTIQQFSQTSWGISVPVSVLGFILAIFLRNKSIPIPFWTREKRSHFVSYPAHVILCLLISLIFGWIVIAFVKLYEFNNPESRKPYSCTTMEYFPKLIVRKSPWIYFPYPGQFGSPGFYTEGLLIFFVATITSLFETISGYYVCANLTHNTLPTAHAVNRGLMVQGFNIFVAGLTGGTLGTNTFLAHIGTIEITRMGNRRTFQIAGLIFIVLAILTKIGTAFFLVPFCVAGGVQLIFYGAYLGIVLAKVDAEQLKSARNLCIMGMSILFGLMIPIWAAHPDTEVNTGLPLLNSIIKGIITHPSFSGALFAFFLDNTISDDYSRRKVYNWKRLPSDEDDKIESESDSELKEMIIMRHCDDPTYGLPFLPERIKKSNVMNYLPFMPSNRNIHDIHLS